MEQTVESATCHQSAITEPSAATEARVSGMSWAALIAGAFLTAALSIILLALGARLGFSSFSVWSNIGAWSTTIGVAAITWLIVMQIISSSMGGYLPGRPLIALSAIETDFL